MLDETDVALTPTVQADVREPISSSCTANPFNADGAACQGAAVGTPFFLFTNGAGPLSLFADAYQPSTPVTGAATAIETSTATISGSVNPDGAAVSVSFQFGTTTAYGQSTLAQKSAPTAASTRFSAALTGLPAGTVIHYRAIAVSDFGTLVGADATLTTSSPTPPPPPAPKPGVASLGLVTVKGTTATVPVSCTGATTCQVSLRLTLHETLRGRRIVAVSAAKTKKVKRTHRLVVVGSKNTTVRPGRKPKLKVSLNHTGRSLLTARHRLTVTLTVRQRRNGKMRVVAHRKATFTSPRMHKRHH